MSIVQELKRRGILHLTFFYIVGSWLALQVADVLFAGADIPLSAIRYVLIAEILVFPFVIIFGWLFDVSGGVITRDRSRLFSPDISRGHRLVAVDYAVLSVLTLAVSAILFGTGINLVAARTAAQETVTIPTNSLAVFPFKNLSDESAYNYIGYGVAVDIINKLANLKELSVIPQSVSFPLEPSAYSIDVLRERLRVRYLIQGNLWPVGEKIRITAQMIDTQNHEFVFSESYDLKIDQILRVSDDLAIEIINQLPVSLSSDSLEFLNRKATSNDQAYDFYLQGRNQLRNPDTVETLATAQQYFEEALRLDEQFASAYAGLCETYLNRYLLNRDTENVDAAETVCGRALELDDSLSEVSIALSKLYLQTGRADDAERTISEVINSGNINSETLTMLALIYSAQDRVDEADAAFERATRLATGNWDAYTRYGIFLRHRGRFNEAIVQFEHVTRLTPNNPTAFNNLGVAYAMSGDFENAARTFRNSLALSANAKAYTNTANMYYYLGDYAQASDILKHVTEIVPDVFWAWGNYANVLRYVAGDEEAMESAYERAIQLAESATEVNQADWNAWKSLANYYANLGQNEKAVHAIRQAKGLATKNPTILYFEALVLVRLGNPLEALNSLELAAEYGYPRRIIEADPEFESLKKNSRFRMLTGQHHE